MGTVTVVGHLCVDLRPHLPEPPTLEPGTLKQIGALSLSLGGSVANTGRVLAVLGAPVVGWAAVGPDDLGGIIRNHLGRIPGFDFRPVAVSGGSSYTIVVEPPGTDRLFWHYPGANAELDLSVVDLTDSDLVHFGYPSLMPGVCADGGAGLVALFERAAAAGVTTSLDLAWVDPDSAAASVDWPALLRGLLPLTDVVSPSYSDLACVFGLPTAFDPAVARSLVDRLLAWGAGIVMITAGTDGIVIGSAPTDRLERLRGCGASPSGLAGQAFTLPARPPSRLATTAGAGDAATAGLLFGLRAGLGLRAAGELAADVAAGVIEQGGTGAFSGLG